MINFVFAILLCIFIYTMAMVGTATVLRVRFTEVGFFLGPALFTFKYRGVSWRINALPLGSYVKFIDEDEFDPQQPEHRYFFSDEPLVKTQAVNLSGSLSLVLIAIACLTPTGASVFALDVIAKMFVGAIEPVDEGAAIVAACVEFMSTQPFYIAFGATAMVFAIVNLLPIPSSAGGGIYMLPVRKYRLLSEGWQTVTYVLGFVAYFLLILLWLVALVAALMG